VFKGAATTIISQARDEPLYRHYWNLLDGGTKLNLARLSIARQIAAVTLARTDLAQTGAGLDQAEDRMLAGFGNHLLLGLLGQFEELVVLMVEQLGHRSR
jgi:hypothetical protein